MCVGLCKILCILLVLAEFCDAYSEIEIINRKMAHHIKRKKRHTEEYRRHWEKEKHLINRQLSSKDKSNQLSRHSSDAYRIKRSISKFGKAVYFSGRQVLKLSRIHRDIDISEIKDAFTAEIWIKPEGGQHNPVHILEMVDSCSTPEDSRGWAVGIATLGTDGERNARLFFSLRTARSQKRTLISSHTSFEPNKWAYIVVSFNSSEMTFYVNSARIAVSHDQIGQIFPLVQPSCLTLFLGGSVAGRKNFRGTVDELRIWRVALSHREITRNIDRPSVDEMILKDNFQDLKFWTLSVGNFIEIVTSDIPIYPKIQLRAPPCGLTICDNPDVILGYTENWQLRTTKHVRYRIINLMNDDGSRPTVTETQIHRQHRSLNLAFKPYNISFELDIVNINNTSLNSKFMMFGCNPQDVGNGQCNPECEHTGTGKDGGDCDNTPVVCDLANIGNGRCDYECNRHRHQWDGGDCCIPSNITHYTCHDPLSPHRGYMSILELKEMLQFDSSSHLNVYFVAWTTAELIGVATFPWEKHVYSVQGGTVVQPETFGIEGQMNSLVHEIGHNFGLWHVHHGVSEMRCGDPCMETTPSMVHGDLCADTLPTPKNQACHDPLPTEDACGTIKAYRDTPYRNYMTYAGDNCTREFTPHQTARMHCYLDLVYQPWRVKSKEPSPVPLAPRIASSGDNEVTMVWPSPLGTGIANWESVCNLCSVDGALTQYAINASSPEPTDRWNPQQATGPPDAEKCDASVYAWMPSVYSCTKRSCRLDVYFKWPVIPERLSIWVVWNAAKGIKKIKLYFEDRQSKIIKDLPAHCDMPVTTRISINKKLTKIRIYTRDQYVAIDAVELVSRQHEEKCADCRQIKYRIHRDPPFTQEPFKTSWETSYTDSDVKLGKSYRYWIKASSGVKLSQSSPYLQYIHGQSYCGDGVVNQSQGEVCDDGNIVDSDGCNTKCNLEDSFHCLGSPSICYIHEGDGVCEEFEKKTSIKDCGFYIPPGYVDQVPSSAVANPEYQDPDCPVTPVLKHPGVNLVCNGVYDANTAWFPCGSFTEYGDYWLEVYYPRNVIATEVIIHVASDGSALDDSSLTVELLTLEDKTVTLSPPVYTVSCSNNPLHIPVIHDLSTPFYYTKGVRLSFTSFNISISSVRLRSNKYLNPIAVASCTTDQLYNPRSGLCVHHNVSLSKCAPYVLHHGTVVCTGYADGDECSVTCHTGYRATSTYGKLTCYSGQWMNSTRIECVPVDCGPIVIPYAITSCPSGTTFHSNCTFTCQSPSVYKGQYNTVQCESNGLWTTPGGVCRNQCPQSEEVPFANLVSKKCKHKPQPIGSRCKYRCQRGYRVKNGKSKKRILWRRCEDTGEWSDVSCERVSCPAIEEVYHGLYSCTDSVYSGSVCKLHCHDTAKVQVIRCTKNGRWKGRFRMCKLHKASSCGRPVAAGIDFHCTQLVVGSTCRARCKQSNYGVSIKSKRHKPITSRNPREGTLYVVCSKQLNWFPKPADMVCEEKCDKEKIGDGWCDVQNNREYCDWDDGDCCESTVKNGVLLTSSPCITNCCKDPYAIENISKSKLSRTKTIRSNG